MPRRTDPSPLTVAEFPDLPGSRAVEACRSLLHDPARHAPLEVPGRLLGEYFRERGRSRIGRLVDAGNRLGAYCETVVVVGSSRLRQTAERLTAAAAHPFYNWLSPGERGGRPRLAFVEPSLDGDLVQATLDLVRRTSDALDLHDRWALVVEGPSTIEGPSTTVASAKADDLATAERYAAAAPFLAALRQAAPRDDDLRRRLFFLTDEQAAPALPPEWNALPHAKLPRIDTSTLCDGAGLFAATLVGADVVAQLKGAVGFWEQAKRDPALRLAPLVEFLASGDVRIAAWHHALLGTASLLGPTVDPLRHDDRRALATSAGPRLHLFCDAVRRDRPSAAEDGPPVMPADAATFGPFVPVPQAVRRAFDDLRRAERSLGTASAAIRLRRLNDTALGELCGWFDAVKVVLDVSTSAE